MSYIVCFDYQNGKIRLKPWTSGMNIIGYCKDGDITTAVFENLSIKTLFNGAEFSTSRVQYFTHDGRYNIEVRENSTNVVATGNYEVEQGNVKSQVYGYKDSKARSAVYPRSEVYTKDEVYEKSEVYAKSQYTTLNYTMTVPDDGRYVHQVITLPQGWSLDNCFIIAANAKLIHKSSGVGQWFDLHADTKEDNLANAGSLYSHTIETYNLDATKLFFCCDISNRETVDNGYICGYKSMLLRLLIMKVS